MSARNTFAATRRSHTILQWLQNGEEVTINRVCDSFGIKYPQAREDIKLLEELYGLKTHRRGRTKVWTWTGSDQLVVTVATAAALEFGGVALDVFDGTPYEHEIRRIASDFRDRFQSEQRERLDRLSQGLHLRRTWLPVQQETIIEHIEEILDAIFLSNELQTVYERADGEVGEYHLVPERLIWYQGRLWLLADHRGKLKLFDVAGIQTAERIDSGPPTLEMAVDGKDGAALLEDSETMAPTLGTDEVERSGWKRSSAEDLDDYFANAFGIFAGNYPVADVVLEVRGPWANYLRRYRLHPSQVNEDAGNALKVTFQVGLCPEFKSFVLGMIPDVSVIAPLELKQELADRVAQWLQN